MFEHPSKQGLNSNQNKGHQRVPGNYISHTIHVWYIFTYIYHKNQPNVGKYTIHGCHGYIYIYMFLIQLSHLPQIASTKIPSELNSGSPPVTSALPSEPVRTVPEPRALIDSDCTPSWSHHNFPKWIRCVEYMGPTSSILIGFSITNHPFWGTPIFGNTHMGPTHLPWNLYSKWDGYVYM